MRALTQQLFSTVREAGQDADVRWSLTWLGNVRCGCLVRLQFLTAL